MHVFLPLLRFLFAVQDRLAILLHRSFDLPTKPPFDEPPRPIPGGTFGRYTSRGGEKLFYRRWIPRDQPSAAVIAIHGTGAHGEHFWILGRYLAAAGMATYAPDLRGHGLSEGPRAFEQADPVVDGLLDLVPVVRRHHPGCPVFLLGESFGALLVMMAAGLRPDYFAGAILCGPAVAPTEERSRGRLLATLREYASYAPSILFNSRAPVIDITAREERVSRDAVSVERARTDPLRNNRISVRTLAETYRIIKAGFSIASGVLVPTLLLQGGHDLITRPEAIWTLRETITCGESEVQTFPDAYHGLFFDPDTPLVLAAILAWLDKRVLLTVTGELVCERY